MRRAKHRGTALKELPTFKVRTLAAVRTTPSSATRRVTQGTLGVRHQQSGSPLAEDGSEKTSEARECDRRVWHAGCGRWVDAPKLPATIARVIAHANVLADLRKESSRF